MTLNLTMLFLTLSVVGALFVVWKRRVLEVLFIPVSTKNVLLEKKSLRSALYRLTPYFFWLALVCIAFALSEPKVKEVFESKKAEKATVARSGNALYFLIDQSGSMAEKVVGASLQKQTKLTLAKDAVRGFLMQEGSDLVGLVAFARAAKTLSPLTLDRTQVSAELDALKPITEQRLNGTAIGYAIFKTVNTIVATKYFAERQKKAEKPVYSIENQAIVVITDGLQAPHPDDRMHPFRYIPIQEALRYAEQNDIKVYFIGVDPIFRRSDAKAEVSALKEQVNKTGGKLYLMSPEMALSKIFSEIAALEKSPLKPVEVLHAQYSYKALAHFFVAAALVFLLCAIAVETLFAKRVP